MAIEETYTGPRYIEAKLDDCSLGNLVFTFHIENKRGVFGEVKDWDVVWRALVDSLTGEVDKEAIFQKLKYYWTVWNPAKSN